MNHISHLLSLTMLVRGVEWAASGTVTYPVPADFPTASEIQLHAIDWNLTPPEGHVSASQADRADKAPANNKGSRENNDSTRDRSPESPGPLGAIVGDYYYGDGLGINCSLVVKPEGRFTFIWRGCLGLYGRNQGGAKIVKDHLILVPEQPNDPGGFGSLSPDLIPVRWGERLYLVSKEAGKSFCHEVNEGREPRSNRHGTFYIRRGDWEKKVTGLPDVPNAWKSWLRKNPAKD